MAGAWRSGTEPSLVAARAQWQPGIWEYRYLMSGSKTNLRVVARGLRFPEGPIAMADGSVLLVEVARGTLTRVRPDGALEVVAELGGGPNGAALGPDGAVYVCNNGGFRWHEGRHGLIPLEQADDYSGGRIERVDLATGEVRVLYDRGPNGPLRGPNDIVFDRAGGMWFTDHGKTRARDMDRGGVYYASIDGGSIARGDLPAAHAERHRPVARRVAPVRRRDPERAAVGVRPRGAGRGEAAPLPVAERRRAGRGAARLPAVRLARARGRRQHLRRDPVQRRHHASSRRTARTSCTCRCPTTTPPTSASAGRTCAPPTSRSAPRAGWSRSTGPGPACALNFMT